MNAKKNFYFKSSKIHLYHFITVYRNDMHNKKMTLKQIA